MTAGVRVKDWRPGWPARHSGFAVVLLLVLVALPLPAALPHPPQRAGFSGVGEARIGTPLWRLLEILEETVTIESLAGGDCTHVYAADSDDLLYMVVAGRLARIEVRSRDLATISGVRVGDSEDKVFAAYGDRVVTSPHAYGKGHYLTVRSGDGKSALVFETDSETIRSYRVGRLPEAIWVEGCS